MNTILARELTKVMCHSIVEIYEMIGMGRNVLKDLDVISTKRFDDIITLCSEFNLKPRILSIEGKRDGVFVSRIQRMKDTSEFDLQIVIDPIEGTLPCSLGGSRAFSVLAVDSISHRKYRCLPDRLSCFSIASNKNKNLVNSFFKNSNMNDFKELLVAQQTSSLHRTESETLWNYIDPEVRSLDFGEHRHYLPNVLRNGIFMAGDSSIPLFIESDNYLGRSGATEALIEARLWKYWSGLLVSGSRIKSYEKGELGYLLDRIRASNEINKYSVTDFFLEDEIDELKELGWNNEDIMREYQSANFAPDYDFIVIASITGTKDSIFKQHSSLNLRRSSFDHMTGILNVPCWVKLNKRAMLIDLQYNTKTGDIKWIKKNIKNIAKN